MIDRAIDSGLAPLSPSSWCAARSTEEMDRGSILFHAPSTVFQSPGGGENQLVQTGQHLEDLGHRVKLFNPWCDRIDDARLLHLFGMSREGLELARMARMRHIPVVLSPICWIDAWAMNATAQHRLQGLANLAKWSLKAAVPQWPTWRRELLLAADAILPNSRAEAAQLIRLFGAEPKSIHVVPNGVSSRFERANPELFRSRYGDDPFVLYVGRIEPRKNVLGLVQASRSLGVPLVAIGNPAPGFDEYDRACREIGGDGVTWYPAVEHDDPWLASAFAAARVFALPSWFETPGLAALEAALAHCAIVITPNGCTREYFRTHVEYARPQRCREIQEAIRKAWKNGPDPGLARHIETHFLWSKVAARTAEVYDQLIA